MANQLSAASFQRGGPKGRCAGRSSPSLFAADAWWRALGVALAVLGAVFAQMLDPRSATI